ncbi:hypothetical protein KR51_00005890 [Rubidibacter lacunae KORDI 51-2]|uniref:Uncharacterized protein n=1 Tax=Rubidibacter lacunae KORDI 51-2 TaxID=582515 RepID=U5DM35_9CHRO|nr:peptide ligase PGM1-related protein [Rubidibacter lacunae]ERN42741.1 hypothetical protein KR51_00005890 [Rubidibacter lacunae KORDI 51-2]
MPVRGSAPTTEHAARFQNLQAQLRDRWQAIDDPDSDNYDILVVPSFSVDQEEGGKIQGLLHYEERLLFSLIRLRNPHARLIYVTAMPLSPVAIEYYLQLLPGIPFSHARDRLLLLTAYDSSLRPLTEKILERPRLIERIRLSLRRDRAYMVCYNSTALEQELSLQLGIPLLASDPGLLYWGSKSGSREIFAETSVFHPDGSKCVWNAEDLARETALLWERQPHLQRCVVKLNEGFSGEGNALLDLRSLTGVAPGQKTRGERVVAILRAFPSMRFQAAGETWDSYARRLPDLGAIVEAFIEGEKRSPSVQGYITPNGKVKILSTHDQILGGADQQIYLGCRFPADAEYRLRLQEYGLRVGQALLKRGAMERYCVDFVTARRFDGNWDIAAVEINLRKGGTTHPFMLLKLLTNGHYDTQTGSFFSQQGQEKFYIASDNLQASLYRGLLPSDLMDIIAHHRLHFDSSTRTGSVFHLLGALSEFGKLGLTSIGNSFEEAEALYHRVEAVLNEETQHYGDRANLSSPTLPIAGLCRD